MGMLKEGRIDIKVIFIFCLAIALILSFIFRPSKGIDMYKDEIKQLHKQNDSLLKNNDSLKMLNVKLDKQINQILHEIYITQVNLDKTNDKIKNLENGKGKVSSYVNNLNADGVAKSLTEYLNRSK